MTSLRVNTDVLADKLRALNTTQQVIESVSQWCIFYRRDAPTIVQYWDQEFRRSSPEKQLSLLYLTNDILQNSRKKGREFAEAFVLVVPKALKTLWSEGDQKINRAVLRLVGVWEERRVFPGKSFRSCLSKAEAKEVEKKVSNNNNESSGLGDAKYRVVEPLAEAIEGCLVNSSNLMEMEQRASIREGLLEQGSLDELREFAESLEKFRVELVADSDRRRRVLEILQDMQTKQDDEIENCQELIMMCEIHKERISNRILDLEPPGSPVPPQMDSIGDLPLQDTEANRDDEEMTDLRPSGTTQIQNVASTPKRPEGSPSLGVVDPSQPAVQEVAPGSPNAPTTASMPETSKAAEELNGAGSGSTALEMVVKGLAESDQPAALLAQVLQELPEEVPEQFGFYIADLLNQPYSEETDVPPKH